MGKLPLTDEGQKRIVQRTTQHLDEGTKVLGIRQKHIRIADRSDLGWAVVEAYMDDELASNSDDERKLFKASREAQQTVKRKRAELAAAAATARPRMVGPCYRCGELGHLVANCPKPRQQYPFEQSLVKETDMGMHGTTKECVDIVKEINVESAAWAGLSPEGVDRVMLREQGTISCSQELFPTDEAGRPSDQFADSLGPDSDVPIDGEGRC